MKIFFLASLLVSLSAHAAGPVIFSESFPVVGDDNSPETIAKEVIQTYADALAAKAVQRPPVVVVLVHHLRDRLPAPPRRALSAARMRRAVGDR